MLIIWKSPHQFVQAYRQSRQIIRTTATRNTTAASTIALPREDAPATSTASAAQDATAELDA